MNRNKGFTIVELLIVISIMGIISAISVPGLLEWRRNAQYKEAAQTALAALRQAKGQAVNLNQSVTVLFTLDSSADNTANKVKIGSGADTFFQKGIEIKWGATGNANCNDEDNGDKEFTFLPNGTFDNTQLGYICIFDGTTSKYRAGVAVANTGRVLMQKLQGGVWK